MELLCKAKLQFYQLNFYCLKLYICENHATKILYMSDNFTNFSLSLKYLIVKYELV